MKLLIIGAGGHGRCCLDIARSMNKYNCIHFLDDNHVGEDINDCHVIDSIDKMELYSGSYDEIFIAIGNNKVRHELYEKAKDIGYKVATLISLQSCVSPYAKIGDGCVIFPFTSIEANAVIENNCILTSNVVIHHDVRIEESSLIYSGTIIRPEAVIGCMSLVESHGYIPMGKIIPSNSIIKV